MVARSQALGLTPTEHGFSSRAPNIPPPTAGFQLQWGHWKCQCLAGKAAPFKTHLLQFAFSSHSTGIHSPTLVC